MVDVPPLAERLSRMIRIATVSAGAGSEAPFDRFASLLRELYPLTHASLDLERVGGRGLLLRWRGRSDRDPVVLMAHYDVVPADRADGWSRDPFSGAIEDGWVHGRGALDDKGPLLAILEAVELLLESGFVPARDVWLSFGGDEEVSGTSALAIADALHDRGVSPWLVIDEGGAVVDAPLPFVRGRVAMIGVGEKGIATITLTARGDGGHASAPGRHSAITRIARAVDRLGPATFRPRMPRSISRMLGVLSARAAGPARLLLLALSRWPWLAGRVFSALGGEPAALARTTIAATMQSGGSAANVLPARASATLNLRIIPGETASGALARVRRRIRDPHVDVELSEGDDPSPQSSVDTAQFASIADALAVSYPDALPAPYLMMQASDARHFHRLWPAVYRFAPLEMSARQRASIHGVDECVSIASLERGRDFHEALIRGLG